LALWLSWSALEYAAAALARQAPSLSNLNLSWKLSEVISVFLTNEIASAEFAFIVPRMSTPLSSISMGNEGSPVTSAAPSPVNANFIEASCVRISRPEWNHCSSSSVESLGRNATASDAPRRSRSSSRSVA
jgi:hypothetical protein